MALLDAGYSGVDKRPEAVRAQAEGKIRGDIDWSLTERRGTITKVDKDTLKAHRGAGYVKAQIRARVEHPLHAAKNLFRHEKTRYMGSAKNEARLYSRLALANLVLVKMRLMALYAAWMRAP